MFRARYAMAPLLSLLGCSVDQLDGPCSQVGIAAVGGGALDAVPGDPLEPARDRSAVPGRRVAGDMERGPTDDVVDGVRARAGERVVDREEQHGIGVHALLERVLDERV